MIARELLNLLSALKDVDLEKEISIELCDTKYPTNDGDYDNMHYQYDSIINIFIRDDTVVIFGFVS